MEAENLRGLTTAVALLAYLGVVWWAYRTANRERFEHDALLPFADEPAASGEVASRCRGNSWP